MTKQFTLPPDSRKQGDPNPASDMDAVVDALIAAGAPYNVLSAAWGTVDNTGVADSTAGLNACLAAAATAGAAVQMPPGTYKISGPLNIATGQVINGSGENSTIIQQTSTTADTLTATNQRYITIRDLQLTGPATGTGRGIAFLFTTTALAGINCTNMIVKNFGGDGVHLETPIVSNLLKIRSEGNGGHGFYVNGGTSCGFKVCYANACIGNGYELDALNYSQLDSCAADNCAIGYSVNGSSAIVMNGCGAEVVTTGYKITGGSANVSMLCCKVLNASGQGFWITGSSVFNFLLGVREATPAGATAGIQVDAGSTATIISPQNTTALNLAAGSSQLFLATNLEIHSTGQAKIRADRGSGAAIAALIAASGGGDKWSWQMSADATNDLHLINLGRTPNQEPFGAADLATAANLWHIARPAGWGGMTGGQFIGDASTVPSSDPAAGGFLYSDNGVLKWRDKFGTVSRLAPPALSAAQLFGAPAGATGETAPRRTATGTSAATLVSGTVYVNLIQLAAGTPVNSVSLYTAAAAVATAASITHGWYALLNSAFGVVAVSADQIAPAAFLSVINTEYNLAVLGAGGAAYLATYTGAYYIAESVSISAGAMPQFAVSGSTGTGVGTTPPILSGPAGTQAAPPAIGATLTTPSFSNNNVFYAYTK